MKNVTTFEVSKKIDERLNKFNEHAQRRGQKEAKEVTKKSKNLYIFIYIYKMAAASTSLWMGDVNIYIVLFNMKH